MGTFDRADAKLIGEEIASALRNQPSGGGYNRGPGFAGNTAALSAGVNTFTNITGQLVQGTYNLNNAVGTVTQIFSMFGPLGAAFGSFGKSVSEYVLDIHAQNEASSRYGAAFNQNLGLYTELISGAGLTQADYNRLLEMTGGSLTGLSSTANTSAQIYLHAARELRENEDLFKARLAGLPMDAFHSSLATTSKLMQGLDMNSQTAMRTLLDSSAGAALEIDNMSRITGRSRQEIQKGIDAQVNSTQMEIAKMAMTEEELEAYESSLPLIESFGPTVTNAFTEMAANQGDIVSKQTAKTMGALGVLDNRLPDLLRQLSVATNPEERESLKRTFMQVYSEASQNRETFRQGSRLVGSTNENAVELTKVLKESVPMLTKTRKMGEEGGREGKTAAEVYDSIISEIGRLRETAGTDKGPEGKAALAAQAIVAAQEGLKSVSAGLGVGINNLNTTVGKEIAKIEELNKYMSVISQQSASRGIDNLEDWLRRKGWTGINLQNVPATETDPRYASGEFGKKPKSPGFDGGTLGSDFSKVDKWFSNFGEEQVARLHGVEAVLRKQDIPAFIQDQLKQTPGIIEGLEGGIRSAANESKSAMPTSDMFEKLFAQFKNLNLPSTVSPVTSSTTMGDQKTITDLVSNLEKLNTKMDRLISTVADGAEKNVRAVKKAGNLAG